MFDKNLVLIANSGAESKNKEILFLKANTLTAENHGKAWVLFEEFEKFKEAKILPTDPLEYKATELDIVTVAFRGNGDKIMTRIIPNFFEAEKEGTAWAYFDKFLEGLKNYAAALKAKEEEVNKTIEALEKPSIKEEPPKKKKSRKKK